MLSAERIVALAHEAGASDIHFVCGLPVKFRINGRLVNGGVDGDAPLSREDCEALARELAGAGYEGIAKIGEWDGAATLAGVRTRINLFRSQGNCNAALRLLSDEIPVLDSLGLPPAVLDFPKIQRGIVLVTGETGSGKSTTLAALIDAVNHTREENIITMEDPIEYVYTPDKCAISQREIGKDSASYADALRAVLREDPDIILIGEMRDLTRSRRRSRRPRQATSCSRLCTRTPQRSPSTAWSTCSPQGCSARFACSSPRRLRPCSRSSSCRRRTAGGARWRRSS